VWKVANLAQSTVVNSPVIYELPNAEVLQSYLVEACLSENAVHQFLIDEEQSLLAGLGKKWGFIEHHAKGLPNRAVVNLNPPDCDAVEFLLGGVPSEIDAEFLLKKARVAKILLRWFETAAEPKRLQWELT
jgi:hypothetical protein